LHYFHVWDVLTIMTRLHSQAFRSRLQKLIFLSNTMFLQRPDGISFLITAPDT
jgi:hypothetical protein